MSDRRWEYGSEFPLDVSCGNKLSNSPTNWRTGSLWGSGRDALKGLIQYGIQQRNWKRFWVPSYLCQDVVCTVVETGIDLCRYSDRPGTSFPTIATERGDALLVVNFFGLRDRIVYDRKTLKSEIIEDHTHDPWSNWADESEADFCIASLRKTLPIPDGGVIWSPIHEQVPWRLPPTQEHSSASLSKLAGMILKQQYLRGESVDKDIFRHYFLEGESKLGCGLVSGITPYSAEMLKTFPLLKWREQRGKNYKLLSSMISEQSKLQILGPESQRCVPFCIVVVTNDKENRDLLRSKLTEKNIYPAILWPLEEGPPSVEGNICDEDRLLNQRLLMLHCDFRYSLGDFNRVVEQISALGE